MYCRNCGTKFVEGGKFCGKCGGAIPKIVSPTTDQSPLKTSEKNGSFLSKIFYIVAFIIAFVIFRYITQEGVSRILQNNPTVEVKRTTDDISNSGQQPDLNPSGEIVSQEFQPFDATLKISAAMRKCPQTSCEINRYYAETAIVHVLGKDDSGLWYKIQAKDDDGTPLIGWMTTKAF